MKPEFIARQSRLPHGWLGQVVARVMALETDAVNRRAVERLALKPGETVLELGYGHGRTLKKVLDQNVGVAAGIDPSDVMFRLAGRRLRREIGQGRCELHRGEARHLPFGDQCFDAAFAVHVVYFWTDPRAEFAEIRRVLRPGGRLLLGFRPRNEQTLLDLPACAYTLRSVEEVATLLLQTGFAEAQGEVEQIGQTEMAWLVAREEGAVGD
jgi:ubiquinone/menaquinone biosynthesis C-methylase UbiE